MAKINQGVPNLKEYKKELITLGTVMSIVMVIWIGYSIVNKSPAEELVGNGSGVVYATFGCSTDNESFGTFREKDPHGLCDIVNPKKGRFIIGFGNKHRVAQPIIENRELNEFFPGSYDVLSYNDVLKKDKADIDYFVGDASKETTAYSDKKMTYKVIDRDTVEVRGQFFDDNGNSHTSHTTISEIKKVSDGNFVGSMDYFPESDEGEDLVIFHKLTANSY